MGDMHRIGEAESSGSTLDLVFVHGLGGHYEETWQHPGNEAGDNWMAWLAEDFPQIAVWSVGYEAAPVEWLKGSSMPLDDRARNLANLVTLHDIGSRPAVWVGHSLGGLVIKALLRYSEGRQDEEARLLENTVGTVFVATPHTGADLATWLDRLARVLRSKSAKDLTANNPLLRVLNTWYRDWATRQRIATLCYMEGRNTAGVRVVDEASADPGIPNVSPIKLDADHIEIAKPAGRDDQLYLGVQRFLRQALTSSSTEKNIFSSSPANSGNEGKTPPTGPQRLFISYSHRDEEQKNELITCIKSLSPRVALEWDVWDDRQLKPGDDFDHEIFARIPRSDIFFALVSRYYLSSDYCQKELYEALRQAEGRGCRVVPVIVRNTPSWTQFPLGHKNAVPRDAKSPADFPSDDEYWAAVQKGLLELFPSKTEGRPPGDSQAGLNGGSQGTTRGSESLRLQQVAFECPEQSAFQRDLTRRLKRFLESTKSSLLVNQFCELEDLSPASADRVSQRLVGKAPKEAMRTWVSVTNAVAELDSSLTQWNLAEAIYLALLPRMIKQDWLTDFLSRASDGQCDVLQVLISTAVESPYRSVEVLLGRLDRHRQIVFQDIEQERLNDRARPSAQVAPANMSFELAAAPGAADVVERLGRYLLARYGDEVPQRLAPKDWRRLNSHLVNYRPVDGKNFYLVVAAADRIFADFAVRDEMYRKLPNLPRVIIADSSGTDPFEDFYDIESNITAFFALKPKFS